MGVILHGEHASDDQLHQLLVIAGLRRGEPDEGSLALDSVQLLAVDAHIKGCAYCSHRLDKIKHKTGTK